MSCKNRDLQLPNQHLINQYLLNCSIMVLLPRDTNWFIPWDETDQWCNLVQFSGKSDLELEHKLIMHQINHVFT